MALRARPYTLVAVDLDDKPAKTDILGKEQEEGEQKIKRLPNVS